jgi:molecular chaperone GrpE
VSDDPTPREAAQAADATEDESSPPTRGEGDVRAGGGAPSDTPTGAAAADTAAGDAATDTAAGDAADTAAGDAADTAAGDAADEGSAASDDAPDSRAAGDDDAELQAAADALEVDLELLVSERAQYLDAYRRAQADFENYRKQAQRRQEDAVVRSLGRFVEGLLPVLDSCDAALAHGANEVEPVLTALYGALSKEGLERIDPKGAAFDPNEAEAVAHEPGEGGEQVVAEVLRPGYRWRGQVLRPAMVKVTG